jgi:hypothetical protein
MPQSTADQPPGASVEGPEHRTRGTVPVLAFAGIAVAVMQTLLVPVIKDLLALLSGASGSEHGVREA